MNTLVLASNNKHKIEEFKTILKNYNILTLNEIGYNLEIEETGQTAYENSLIKAQTIHNYLKSKNLNYYVVADDTGLYVDALNGEPGVKSARYAGDHNDKANREKLLNNLKNITNKKAKFLCVITLIKPNGEKVVVDGIVEGEILDHEEGVSGFGYDPIFYSYELGKTFASATADEKNSVSHRGRAIKNLLKYLD